MLGSTRFVRPWQSRRQRHRPEPCTAWHVVAVARGWQRGHMGTQMPPHPSMAGTGERGWAWLFQWVLGARHCQRPVPCLVTCNGSRGDSTEVTATAWCQGSSTHEAPAELQTLWGSPNPASQISSHCRNRLVFTPAPPNPAVLGTGRMCPSPSPSLAPRKPLAGLWDQTSDPGASLHPTRVGLGTGRFNGEALG